MKQFGYAAVTLLAACGLCVAQAGKASVTSADKKFVTEAAQGGMAEVQLGNLAATKAENPDVKAFGQRMVTDHSKANDQLKSIASQKGITVPTTLGKEQAEVDRLSKLSGAAFDKAYMAHMVKDHTKDVSEFRKESTSASDTDIKNFAAQTLPTLEDHLRMAKDTDSKVRGGGHMSGSADRTNK